MARGGDHLLSPWEMWLNPSCMEAWEPQGHANSIPMAGTPLFTPLFCLQYMLSQETIEALRKPTFDVWLWEPNEVRMPHQLSCRFLRASKARRAL